MNKENNKIENLVFKLIVTVLALVACYIVSVYLLLILGSSKINVISTVWSIFLLPTLLLILIYSKNFGKNV